MENDPKRLPALPQGWRRVARMLVRHRGPVALAWLIATGFLWSAGRDLEQVLEVGATVRGSESDSVRHIIGTGLPGAGVEYAVLVIQGLDPRQRDDHQHLLDTIAGAVGRVPGIELLRYSREAGDTVLAPVGGALVLAALAPDADPDLTIQALRRERDSLALTLPGSLTMAWTGEAALNTDLRRASAHDANRAEWRALPLSLLILVLAFGAMVAAGVPIAIGALTIVCSLGLAGLVGRVVPLSLMLQSLVTMIGLGLGIDYGLLMVSRFREGLRNGLPPLTAAAEAGETAGATIAISAAAVFIGFAALVLVPLGELRSVGFGGMLAVLFAAALASTLVPGMLAWLGPRVDALPIRRRTAQHVSPRWLAWGRWVVRHPWRVLLAAGLPLAWLGWQATDITIGTPRADWLPPHLESTRGLRALESMDRAALLQTVRVVIQLPADGDILAPENWLRARQLRQRFMTDPRVATVVSFDDFSAERPPSRLKFYGIPRDVRTAYVTDDRGTVLLDVLPHNSVTPEAMIALVNDWRTAVSTGTEEEPKILLGGLPALRADYENVVTGWFSVVALLVIVGTFVGLIVSFRSLLIPLKALALNLVSVAGGFGVVKLVFQDGIGLHLLGLDHPVAAIFPVVPTIAFCTVFGLSMDYEVFLVARVREFIRRGHDDQYSIVHGLAHSAPVITSAAAVMVVVFGAFTLGDFLVIKILGLALAASIALDATLVRVALGPALLALAGRWNWWPGNRDGSRNGGTP